MPFHNTARGPWLGIGIAAAWMMTLLSVSYYARAKIGYRRWRILHRCTALAWIAGIVHALGQGADAGAWWCLAMLGAVALPSAAALLARTARGLRPRQARRSGALL